jgi:SAM-dependent methyltransferase
MATAASESWFADDAFWEASYPAMFPDSSFPAAEADVEAVLQLAKPTEGAVLDLACGPGRHSVALARRGLSVTGVDRSPFLLDKARKHGSDAAVEVEWIEADMREFVRPAAYSLVLNLFTSFGYFRTEAENQRVLKNVYASLRPGGAFVLDVAGKEVLARIYQPTGSSDVAGAVVVQRRRVVEDWSQMANEWMLIEPERVRTFRFQHWIYSGRELRQMLLEAGFERVKLFGNFSGAPYDTSALRLVACAGKPQV